MTPEQAAYCSDLRARSLANEAKGLPPHAGITAEELLKAIEMCRVSYTAAQSKSKASGVSAAGGAAPDLPKDLTSLFTTSKS
jgi:hypothetical protein